MRRAVLALLLAYACSESGSDPLSPPDASGGSAGESSAAGATSGAAGEPQVGAGGESAPSEGGAPPSGQGGGGAGGESADPWTRETWSPTAAVGGECETDADCCPVDVEACFIDESGGGAIVGSWEEPSAGGAGGSDGGQGGDQGLPKPTDPAPLRCFGGLCAFGAWEKPGDCGTFKFGRVCRALDGYCGLGPSSARPEIPLGTCVTSP